MSWNVNVPAGPSDSISFEERAEEAALAAPASGYLKQDGALAQFKAAVSGAVGILDDNPFGDSLANCTLSGHVNTGDEMSSQSYITVSLFAPKP